MLRLVADALFVISAMKGRQTTRLGSVRTIFLHSAQTIAGYHRSEFKLFFFGALLRLLRRKKRQTSKKCKLQVTLPTWLIEVLRIFQSGS